ncbi:TRAP transporter substrate-binding protein DctP [Microbacterium sp. NPDC055442]
MSAIVVASVLALTACGGGGGGEGGSTAEPSSGGVPYGASKAEYQAAFEDIDPITLITQTAGAPGNVTSEYFEAYQDAITDWSGGKITFETNYAYSIAPPTEVSAAIADGRLDMSYTIPAYHPEELPTANALIDMSISGQQTPLVGYLQLMGWSVELSLASEEIRSEFERMDLYPLLPVYSLGPDVFTCAEPRSDLAELQGATARMGARLHAEQLGALGVQGVSMSLAEIYEALQRGVIDCTVINPLTASITGTIEIAPNARYVPETGFSGGVGALVINNDLFASLPLPARQLLHDRLDVFVEAQIASVQGAFLELVTATEEHGGTVEVFEQDVRDALAEVNADIIEASKTSLTGVADPGAFVDTSEAAMKRWYDIVVDLGYDPEITYDDFAQWQAAQPADVFGPFLDALFGGDVLSASRPS